MTTIELKQKKKIIKKQFNNTDELALNMLFIDFKRKKWLKPKDIITKYKLNKKNSWKKENITKQIDKIAYNL